MKPDIELLQTEKLDKLLCRMLWCQLQSMGLLSGTEINLKALKTQSGLSDIYGRWLEESIAVLTRNNYLRNNGSSYVMINPDQINIETEWQKWERRIDPLRENLNLKAQIDLVEATLRVLPEILTGKILATDIMFPNSSMELVEGIYKNNTAADYFNEMLANIVCAYIQERLTGDPSARITVIEIGAGTGGTSTMVFQKLKPYREHIQEYCYTDISKAFLLHAETEYGPENPYLTYRIFNVEKPIAGQEIKPGGYDLAIATNVLHATKNIHQTIQNAKAALKKNGLLLLNEISQNSLFAHLTFGLLQGWWLYEDQT
jgi:2-polyprenyl-3-methyl-5-hydroxy-6-metoxy-1,4-benzoquinol methylase